MVAIVWFRNDLRLADHLALDAAIKTGMPILPIYTHDENHSRKFGGAAKWWLHHSLLSLQKELKKCKADLIFMKGNALDILKNIDKQVGISHIFWHRRYNQEGKNQDQEIKKYFKHINCQEYNGSLLFEPENHQTQDGKPFKVYSPFWKNCLKTGEVPQPIKAPTEINFDKSFLNFADNLNEWKFLPTKPDWAAGFRKTWQPGEKGAQKLFNQFLTDKLHRYKAERSYPAALAMSDLSPHIRFGEISIRQLWHQVKQVADAGECVKSCECFLSELGWREFSYYTLFYNPKIATEPLKENFKKFPWQPDKNLFAAWTKGLTGYPLIDAGMRQLWHTGYMHNRVRLVVASFLVKDLFQPWQEGEKWFWDCLVDADQASNGFNWQWVAGCGTDAAPYFRIFNPILQSKKFDPNGEYIKYWVPELKNLEGEFIHEPWKMEKKLENYPQPIVDHYHCKEIALAMFDTIKQPLPQE